MILIDTTPLVALCDDRDADHERARRELRGLSRAKFALVEPVLTEAAFHLPNRAQRARLRDFLHAFDVASLEVADRRALWFHVMDWLSKYSQHEPDWADGYIAVHCSRDRKLRLWTYDREFQTIWRRADGSPIPLVKS
jgi:predicted nucleic acid-binding protein